ncbi:hypothetical protein LOAG_15825, partial [Loa loa]
ISVVHQRRVRCRWWVNHWFIKIIVPIKGFDGFNVRCIIFWNDHVAGKQLVIISP